MGHKSYISFKTESSDNFHPNAHTPYFCSRETHRVGCEYEYEPASAKWLGNYRVAQQGREAINRNLQSCLDSLHISSSKKAEQADVSNRGTNRSSQRSLVSKGSKKKRIPRKKLTAPIHEHDYNTPKLFYGSVLAEWNLEHSKYLHFKNPRDSSMICSLGMSDSVYSYLAGSFNFINVKACDVAFFSEMQRRNGFNNCRIKYSTEIIK